jgi:putative tryptophan/tyrosine transport system substrate-binding protein
MTDRHHARRQRAREDQGTSAGPRALSVRLGRRRFAGTAAAALVCALAPAAGWQQSLRVHRLATLGNEANPPWQGLYRGLHDLGYVVGRNLVIEARWSDGVPERLPAFARELVALKPEVIVVSGSQAALAAKGSSSTIPIVMALSQHPERIGLVSTLAHPGGNVTGLSTIAPQLMAKKLEVLRELAPRVARVAVLWNPDSVSERIQLEDLRSAAAAMVINIESVEARRPEDVSAALQQLTVRRADALLVIGNPVTFRRRRDIADFARGERLPSVFEEQLFVEAGGLASYGPSFEDLFRRAAAYVDRILKGARPADLPVEQPTRFEIAVNRRTAHELGLAVPPSLELRADRLLD